MNLLRLGFRCRPIDAWPGELTKGRRDSPFKTGWSQTLSLLEKELRHLAAKGDRSLLLAVTQEEIRQDGALRPHYQLQHPGVILSLDSRFGPLKYACDRFSAEVDNLRAIALGLEALRKVERYGISRRGEQYQGYRQLTGTVQQMTADVAANILERWSGIPASALTIAGVLDAAYRLAVKKVHPDSGGTDVDFRAVQEAREVLGGKP